MLISKPCFFLVTSSASQSNLNHFARSNAKNLQWFLVKDPYKCSNFIKNIFWCILNNFNFKIGNQ